MEDAAGQGVPYAKQYLKHNPKPPTKGYILNRDLAKRVRVIQMPLPDWWDPLTDGTGGLTLGRFIFLNSKDPWRNRSRSGRSPLIAHELGHVRQQAQVGTIPMTLKYISDYARNRRHMSPDLAYHTLPDELNANAGMRSWENRVNAEYREREAQAADRRRRVHAWWGKNYPRARDAVKDIPRRVGEIWNDKSTVLAEEWQQEQQAQQDATRAAIPEGYEEWKPE